MAFKSTFGSRFWQQGLAWPVYHAGPDSEAKLLTQDAAYMLQRAGHPWQEVDFAPALLSLPVAYVEQHGVRVMQ